MAAGLVTAGSPVATVFAGLLLNARHLTFGPAVADVLGTRWPGRLAGAVAAWRGLPFVAVVIIAAATAALLRLAGVA
jgi:hypothetical protein